MGYYNHFGFMSKEKYNDIKSLTPDELFTYLKLDKDEENDYIHMPDHLTHLYNFGKDVEFEKFPPKTRYKFFTKPETRKFMGDDTELYRVNRDFFEFIINQYGKKVTNYYNRMFDPFANGELLNSVTREINSETYDYEYTFDFYKITQEESNALHDILEHIRSFRWEWINRTPYDLNDSSRVSKSDKFEYSVFELTRICKTFDWENNVLIYYGG